MVSTALLMLNVAAPQVALEEIGSSLGASFSELQWVLSGYALALAVLLLTAGSLADRFGRRKLFLGGLTLFSARLGAVRRRARPERADRRAAAAGRRRGDHLPQLAGDPRRGVPGRRAAAGDRRVGRGDRARVRGRPADRRHPRRHARLAGGVRRQRAARRADDPVRDALRARDARPRPAADRLGGRRHAVRRPVPRRLRRAARQRAGLDELDRARLPGRRRRAAGRVPGRRAPHARARCSTSRCSATARSPARRWSSFLLGGGTFAALVFITLFLLDVQGRDPIETGLVLAPFALVAFVVSAVAGRVSERLPLRVGLVTGMLVMAAGVLITRALLGPDVGWLELQVGPAGHRRGRRARQPARHLRAPRRAPARPRRARLGAQQHRAADRAGGGDRGARRAAGGVARRRRPRAGVRRRRRRSCC